MVWSGFLVGAIRARRGLTVSGRGFGGEATSKACSVALLGHQYHLKPSAPGCACAESLERTHSHTSVQCIIRAPKFFVCLEVSLAEISPGSVDIRSRSRDREFSLRATARDHEVWFPPSGLNLLYFRQIVCLRLSQTV